jgi:proline dehydrogenase
VIPPVARRFIAGETAETVLAHARELNERNVGAICNRLGEHYEERAPADEDAAAYCDLVDDIADADLRACISVKPSQIGLDVSEAVFRENLERILGHARDRAVFVWVDMEDHTTTDATLAAYTDLVTDYDGGLGLCLQANLKRTREDIRRLADLPGKVRLVKGAYDEPAEIAYTEKAAVDEAYRSLLTYAFEHFDGGIAVGSHDPAIIDLAAELHAEHGTPYEVQMLMGVRTDAQYDLAEDVPVWQYVPYGNRWLSYFYRRLSERRENITFAFRALVGW